MISLYSQAEVYFMKYKILIVDDEADIVSMLKDYFEFNGYDTLTVRSIGVQKNCLCHLITLP